MTKIQDFHNSNFPQIRKDINDFIETNNYKLLDIKYQYDEYKKHFVLVLYDETYVSDVKPMNPSEDINP